MDPCSDPQMEHGAIRVIRAIGAHSASVVVGHILICDDGEWREVCDDEWSIEDAQVVCRQLGFSTQGIINQRLRILVNCKHCTL